MQDFINVYVARQPIFDKHRNLYAYELFFRDGITSVFPEVNGSVATSIVLNSSFFNIGVDKLSSGKVVFVNFTEELLLKKIPTLFPREKIVVEILEDVKPTEEITTACQEISKLGYEIALDDFAYDSNLDSLINLSSIIKIDFRASSIEEISKLLKKLSPFNKTLLAEKIETYEEFKKAVAMGFTYFQGYFFSKPEILKNKELVPSKANLLHIITEINKKNCDFEKLEKLISWDVSISYKLFRYLNSAYFMLPNEISSTNRAMILLGENGIKQFISVIIYSEMASEKPSELIRSSVIRARLCELLGKDTKPNMDQSELFLTGLFSHIDALLDNSMKNIMSQLPLSAIIKDALISRTGELADYLKIACCYEKGEWNQVSSIAQKIRIDEARIPECYMDAIDWGENYSTLQ